MSAPTDTPRQMAAWVEAAEAGFLPGPPPALVSHADASVFEFKTSNPSKLPCRCGRHHDGHTRNYHALIGERVPA